MPKPVASVSRVDGRPVTAVIAEDVPSRSAGRVVVGFNWTAVEGPDAVGLAATPNRRDGARTTPATGSYSGRTLAELSRLAGTENPYERAIGIAAANAHWNTDTPALVEGDGLSANGDGSVVVVGRFPGLESKIPNAIVLERNPGPGDRSAEDAAKVVPNCRALIVTASTLVNDTIDDLLALVRPGTDVTIVGPGTPLCPALLHLGIDRLAGFIVTEKEVALQAVMEGAGARLLKRYGRAVTLTAAEHRRQVTAPR